MSADAACWTMTVGPPLANAERWAAGMPIQGYAIDDDAGIRVVDGSGRCVLGGRLAAIRPLMPRALRRAGRSAGHATTGRRRVQRHHHL